MLDERSLQQLAENVVPRDDARARMKAAMQRRIQPQELLSAASSVVPSADTRLTLKQRLMRAIRPESAETLSSLADSVRVPSGMVALKQSILSRLNPIAEQGMNGGLKWAAAFAVFVLIIRSMPLILLAPPLQAEIGVQLIPSGEDVSVYVGGVWRTVTSAEAVTGPIMVRTGESQATLVLNDDGVLRLAPNTTLKLHDIGDRPQFQAAGPTATIIRGEVWAFGLLQPIVDGLTLETSQGVLSLNAGSASVYDDANETSVSVYDKGVTFERGNQTAFLVTGEKAVIKAGKQLNILMMPASAFEDAWVSKNLSQDAVHRGEIAKLQEERRVKMAGILPTSILYPAKRIAEEVDVLFTLTSDGRTEKRIAQANTRLNEALALLKDGQDTEATAPLTEYRKSIVALASDDSDNLVQYLIKKQIADASVSLATTESEDADANVELLQDAVEQVSAVIPDADLSPQDIQGYVLVDKLARINTLLRDDGDSSEALREYAEVSPYLATLLSEDGNGMHPLLQKEARSLLVTTSSLLTKLVATGGQDLDAMQSDVAQYLPPEPEKVLVSEEQLDAMVQAMVDRILVFRHPLSRYNQLLVEMQGIEKNPNRGTLLRRLKAALPVGLGEYVNTEIKKLGDELKQ